MSILCTKSSLPDTKLVSEEEPFQLRGGSIKQNESFEKPQELKGRSENFKKG
jgi:hypothetical protein